MILDLLQETGVLGEHEIDGCSFSTETTSTADSVDVVFLLHRKLIVDHKSNLLHVNSSREQVSCDKNTNSSASELFHHDFTFLLVHLAVHACNDEVLACHLF